MPSRRAHRSRLKTSLKFHPLTGQFVDVWSVCLSSVTTNVAERAVVGDDENEVRFFSTLEDIRIVGGERYGQYADDEPKSRQVLNAHLFLNRIVKCVSGVVGTRPHSANPRAAVVEMPM